jgi:NADH:ubiquinone oxidoreductase subunit F (NADH-binding)
LTGIMWGIPGPERPGEQLSKRQVLVDRVVTVSGHGVTTPQNLPVPLGTSIGDVIAFCGGGVGG